MTDTEREVLCARIDELCAEVERLHADQAHWELGNCPSCPNVASLQEALEQNAKLQAENERLTETLRGSRREADRLTHEAAELSIENAKLREQLERLQPKDCEGNVLDIADTVNMLRSEYDGDHEWDDVVVELALTKWGGDRWVVRGSKGEAWACDCAKTGYDEDAYESSDDVEPIANPTLIEAENAKLRKLANGYEALTATLCNERECDGCPFDDPEQIVCEHMRLQTCLSELGVDE